MFGRATITLGIGPHSSCSDFVYWMGGDLLSGRSSYLQPMLPGDDRAALKH